MMRLTLLVVILVAFAGCQGSKIDISEARDVVHEERDGLVDFGEKIWYKEVTWVDKTVTVKPNANYLIPSHNKIVEGMEKRIEYTFESDKAIDFLVVDSESYIKAEDNENYTYDEICSTLSTKKQPRKRCFTVVNAGIVIQNTNDQEVDVKVMAQYYLQNKTI